MPLFAITWSYTTDIQLIDVVRADHGAFIKKLAGEGTLKEVAAWADGTGALLVVDGERVGTRTWSPDRMNQRALPFNGF